MAAHGRYTIVRKIADGGMAEIFLGTQHGVEGFARPVVLKRILTAFLADPKFKDMLIDEAHVAMSLNHSNVVQVMDLGQAAGRYFLVLELVDGWDLNQIVNRARDAAVELPPELALHVTAEVCRALAYAHGKKRNGKPLGIVHRDISPHNVLVSEQGEVKLTDFGIAKALGKRERTGTGVIKGKLGFMSPEQASGAALDARSDLFSVGTMLYLLVTGKRPFDAATDLESMLRVQKAEFPAPAEAKPGLAAPLAKVIARAMKLSPGERYQTADEMLADVESVLRGSFKPAGQSELKRWLADLRKRDHAPTLGQAAAPAATGSGSGEKLEGADVVFEDSALGATQAVVTPRPFREPFVAGAMPLRPTGPTRIDRPEPVRPEPARPERRPARGSRVAMLLFVALAAGIGGAVVFATIQQQTGFQTEVRAIPKRPGPVVTGRPVARPDARPGDVTDAAVRPAARPDAAGVAEAAEVGSEAGAEEESEEALIRQVKKAAVEAVVGEEPGEEEKEPERAAGRPGKAPTVSVRMLSRPEGAVIRTKSGVLGRAPMSLRFRSGITYDVTFVKDGYVTTTRRMTVTPSTKTFSVALKKKPARRDRGPGLFDKLKWRKR